MVRRRAASFLCLFVVCGAIACRGGSPPADRPAGATGLDSPDARVRALADGYLAGYFERNPDAVTLFGVPGRKRDKLPDNSLDALKAWHAREDAWLADAEQIDPSGITS